MSYLQKIGMRARTEDPDVLIWELDTAFTEKIAAGGELPPFEAALHELVGFCRFDEIDPWLRDAPQALRRAQVFAAEHGHERMAAILDDALAGRVHPPCAAILTGDGYVGVPLDTICPDDCSMVKALAPGWKATELAIQIELRSFCRAVLENIIAHSGLIELQAPLRLRNLAAAKAETEQLLAGGTTAARLFARLVNGRNPRIAAAEYDDAKNRCLERAQLLPLRHVVAPPASSRNLDRIRSRHGSIVEELLSIHALHDGAELFVVDAEPGFVFAPIDQWEELTQEAIEWGSIQFSDKCEIPAYLHSAIAFAEIPGDAAKWLLITEGPHAGKIMKAEDDLLNDRPRFDSIARLLAVLLADAKRVLSGGHVRYGDLFPIRYFAD